MTANANQPILGVDFTATVAGSGTSFDEGNEFTLGLQVVGPDGTVYVYVHAAEAIVQYDCVAIDENYEARMMGTAEVQDSHLVGFAQVALADNDFGWVALRGANIQCNVLSSCAADVVLYATATDGKLDDSGTTLNLIDGVVAVASNDTATAGNVEVLATYPRASRNA